MRDRDEMLAWRPGDPQTVVPPGTFTRDPRALTAVLTDDSSPALRRVVARMADEVAIEVCGEYRKHDGHDHYHGVAGLRQAAVAGLGCSSGPPKPRSAGEASLFLHHEVANPITAAHAAAVAGGIPAITGVHIVNGDNDSHPMVQAWLGRLQPARRHDELGFHVARMHLPTELLSAAADVETRYFSDPYWPDCWIVSEGLTVVATVGTSVPARGCLAQAYVDVQAAFFTDEAGVAWPLPVPTGGRERQNFNHTVGQLITDAGTDVDKVSSDAESGPLDWASIPLPVVIDADGSYYRW
ncbi:hypothetical protein [Mycolicibacterium setense]|uniref:hypothetical protein n=1 Tax=Mycolicibacterium setense TaxID=431269 RepID=UPI0009ED381D|nr:hypothetical protein [Mycolicibacterium setense]